jgi:Ca2+-binding RTX toxin-like protein
MAIRTGTINDDQLVLFPDLLGDTPDHTYGGYGNDTFYAGYGHGLDYVYGDEGIDLLSIDYAANLSTGPNAGLYLNVTPGRATAFINFTPTRYDTIFIDSIERYTVRGTDVKDFINTYNHGSLGYTDIIISNAGDDVIQTFLGADTIDGGDGNDYIRTNDGGDLIIGGKGDDTIYANMQGGNTKIDGGEGFDIVTSHVDLSGATTRLVFTDTGIAQPTVSLADGTRVSGIEHFDWLTTGSGNDSITYTSTRLQTVNTGAGNDTISGGLGTDSIDGGTGIDLLKLNYSRYDYIGGLNFSVGYSYGPIVEHMGDIALTRNGGTIVDRAAFKNMNRFDITGTRSIDTMTGGFFNDRLAGSDGDDRLTGSRGSDTLLGGNGNDQLALLNCSMNGWIPPFLNAPLNPPILGDFEV